MEKLVQLYQGKEPVVSTFKIFKGFGYKKHDQLKRIIFKNKKLFDERGNLVSNSVEGETKREGRNILNSFYRIK